LHCTGLPAQRTRLGSKTERTRKPNTNRRKLDEASPIRPLRLDHISLRATCKDDQRSTVANSRYGTGADFSSFPPWFHLHRGKSNSVHVPTTAFCPQQNLSRIYPSERENTKTSYPKS
jgi:hypothetical protein